MTIRADIQSLSLPDRTTFWILDLTPIAPNLPDEQRILRRCDSRNEKGDDFLWKGQRWAFAPISGSGFAVSGKGSPRPTLRLPNFGGVMSVYCAAYQDLVQAEVTRLQTFTKYLPAENFIGGNPGADPDQQFLADVYFVARKTAESRTVVEFELRLPSDMEGIFIPAEVVSESVCGSEYKSAECGWVPGDGPYFDADDVPCGAHRDECSRTLDGCEKRWRNRFGRFANIPFDAFPGLRVDVS